MGVALEQKYDIPSPLRSALLKFSRANLSQAIENRKNAFAIDSQKMSDVTTWNMMEKALIKSREAGQDLTRFGVPANVSASLLQHLTKLVANGGYFKEEIEKLKELSSMTSDSKKEDPNGPVMLTTADVKNLKLKSEFEKNEFW